jgi:hypothetical protein
VIDLAPTTRQPRPWVLRRRDKADKGHWLESAQLKLSERACARCGYVGQRLALGKGGNVVLLIRVRYAGA